MSAGGRGERGAASTEGHDIFDGSVRPEDVGSESNCVGEIGGETHKKGKWLDGRSASQPHSFIAAVHWMLVILKQFDIQ